MRCDLDASLVCESHQDIYPELLRAMRTPAYCGAEAVNSYRVSRIQWTGTRYAGLYPDLGPTR